jgi:hypothetical protein
VARLIGINARISNAFARLVLYSFPCICWCYGAGFVFSTLVSCECGPHRLAVRHQGGRLPACSGATGCAADSAVVAALLPAYQQLIAHLLGVHTTDKHLVCCYVRLCCAAVVFWGGPLWQVYIGLRTHACTVSVKGLRPATAAEIERMHNDCAICWMAMTVPGAAQHSTAASSEDRPAAAAAVPDAGAVAQVQGQAPLPAVAGTGGVVGAVRHAPAEGPGDSDGSTLPCGHCYHQTCLTQVRGGVC